MDRTPFGAVGLDAWQQPRSASALQAVQNGSSKPPLHDALVIITLTEDSHLVPNTSVHLSMHSAAMAKGPDSG